MAPPPEYSLGSFGYSVGPSPLLDGAIVVPPGSIAAMRIPPSSPPLEFDTNSPHPSIATSYESASAPPSAAGSQHNSPAPSRPSSPSSAAPITKPKPKRVRRAKGCPHLLAVISLYSTEPQKLYAKVAYIASFGGPSDPDFDAPVPTTALLRRNYLLPVEATGRASANDISQSLKPALYRSHNYFTAPRFEVEDRTGQKYVNDRMSWLIAREEIVEVTDKNPLRFYIPSPFDYPSSLAPGAQEPIKVLRLSPPSLGNLLSSLPLLNPTATHNLAGAPPPKPSSSLALPSTGGGGPFGGGGPAPTGQPSGTSGAGETTRSGSWGAARGLEQQQEQQANDGSKTESGGESDEETVDGGELQGWEEAVEEEERMYRMFSGGGGGRENSCGESAVGTWMAEVALASEGAGGSGAVFEMLAICSLSSLAKLEG